MTPSHVANFDWLGSVPAMLLAVSQQPAFANADLSSLRLIICGGAPVPEPLLKLYAARGVPINQGYGLTETSGVVSVSSAESSPGRNSCNR